MHALLTIMTTLVPDHTTTRTPTTPAYHLNHMHRIWLKTVSLLAYRAITLWWVTRLKEAIP